MSEPFRTDAKQLSQSLNKLLFLVNATSEDRNFSTLSTISQIQSH